MGNVFMIEVEGFLFRQVTEGLVFRPGALALLRWCASRGDVYLNTTLPTTGSLAWGLDCATFLFLLGVDVPVRKWEYGVINKRRQMAAYKQGDLDLAVGRGCGYTNLIEQGHTIFHLGTPLRESEVEEFKRLNVTAVQLPSWGQGCEFFSLAKWRCSDPLPGQHELRPLVLKILERMPTLCGWLAAFGPGVTSTPLRFLTDGTDPLGAGASRAGSTPESETDHIEKLATQVRALFPETIDEPAKMMVAYSPQEELVVEACRDLVAVVVPQLEVTGLLKSVRPRIRLQGFRPTVNAQDPDSDTDRVPYMPEHRGQE